MTAKQIPAKPLTRTETHDRAKQIASVILKTKKPITNEWLKTEMKKIK